MEVLEGDEGDGQPVKQVVVGICAMEKKSGSKPMKEILTRLEEFEFIRTVIFPEDVILKVGGSTGMTVLDGDCLFTYLFYREGGSSVIKNR